jgi:hypothetical protein
MIETQKKISRQIVTQQKISRQIEISGKRVQEANLKVMAFSSQGAFLIQEFF